MSRLKISEDKYSEICNLYLSGFSIEKLEKKYNVSSSVIQRILRINNIQKRDNSHKGRKYNINENYFDEITNQNQAYILGLLFSDGCNSRKVNTIKLELQERDKSILEKINAELDYNRPLKKILLNEKNPNWQNTYNLTITNKHMSEQLESLGMLNNKSLILRFPEWMNDDLIPHFIRGYFDGDGHLEVSKTHFLTIASTLEFCSFLQSYLLDKLNIKSSIYNTANKESNTKILHICNKKQLKIFLNYIYSNAELYIDRKYDTYQYFLNKINNSLIA